MFITGISQFGHSLVRDNIKSLVRVFAQTFEVRTPIYEFGSLQIGPEGYADLRPYFPGMKYVGCDFREGPGVDQVQDLAQLSLPDKSVGTIICMDTIEHVFQIFKAFEEMHRVLVDDGTIVVSSVMDFWIHSAPYDYWRFTPEAVVGLLQPYPLKVIGFEGLPDFPHAVWGVAFKTYNMALEDQCRLFCKAVEKNLVALEQATWQARSLNGKFKVWRKRLTYKVFGPKSEYNKAVNEFKAGWRIIGPG